MTMWMARSSGAAGYVDVALEDGDQDGRRIGRCARENASDQKSFGGGAALRTSCCACGGARGNMASCDVNRDGGLGAYACRYSAVLERSNPSLVSAGED